MDNSSDIIRILQHQLSKRSVETSFTREGVLVTNEHGSPEQLVPYKEPIELFSVAAGKEERYQGGISLIDGDQTNMEPVEEIPFTDIMKDLHVDDLGNGCWLVRQDSPKECWPDDLELVPSCTWKVVIEGEERMQEYLALTSEKGRREFLGIPL